MQLISKFTKGICFLLCVVDIFSKYGYVILLNNKRGIKNTNILQKNLKNSNCKQNKIIVEKGSEFYR